jgi:hypothetical protein
MLLTTQPINRVINILMGSIITPVPRPQAPCLWGKVILFSTHPHDPEGTRGGVVGSIYSYLLYNLLGPGKGDPGTLTMVPNKIPLAIKGMSWVAAHKRVLCHD